MAVTNDHTVKAFDEDLNRLRGLISEMGGRAEQALLQAMSALNNGDLALASQVVEGDKKIDALEAEIEQLTTQTIALRAPMADDLREMIDDQYVFAFSPSGEGYRSRMYSLTKAGVELAKRLKEMSE